MAISVKINGTSVGSRILPKSVSFARTIEYRGRAQFTLKAPSGDPFEPQEDQKVEIFDASARVWQGAVFSYKRTFAGNSGNLNWDISAVTLERRLDMLYISPRIYKNTTAGAIVADLLSSTGSGQGIAAGTIEAGATISKVVYNWTRLSDAIAELATQSNKYWLVDADANLHFASRTTFSAPFTLGDSNVRRVDHSVDLSLQDRRTRQRVRANWAAFAPEIELFSGDGSTVNFTLSKAVDQVAAIVVTTGFRASSTGNFTGLPSNGETFTLGGFTYTWRTALDNTQFGGVLIGGTASACCQNLVDAINNSGNGKGTRYSLPTWTHFTCQAEASSTNLLVIARAPGTPGNAIAIGGTTSHLTLAGALLIDGVDGINTPQEVGVADVDTDKDWYYAPGEAGLFNGTGPMAIGRYAVVSYRPVGGDVVAVEDTSLIAAVAAVDGTTGVSEDLAADTNILTAAAALDTANGLLGAYKTPSTTIRIILDQPGILPGQLVTLAMSSAPFTRLNGNWLITEVAGSYGGNLRPGFRYALTAITGARIGTWLRGWEQLAATDGSAGSSGSSGTGGGGGGGDTAGMVASFTLTANAMLSAAAPSSDGQALTVRITENATGGWTITWDPASFDADTLVDLDKRPSKLTVYEFKALGGKWTQVAYPLMRN